MKKFELMLLAYRTSDTILTRRHFSKKCGKFLLQSPPELKRASANFNSHPPRRQISTSSAALSIAICGVSVQHCDALVGKREVQSQSFVNTMQSTTILSFDASEQFAGHVYITVVHLMVSLNGCYEFIDFAIICDEADRACRDDEQSFA